MSYGFRARNGNNHVTIDENLVAYAYLGKYVLPSVQGNVYVDVTCVGVPLIYFDVPYNVTGVGENDPSTYSTYGGPKSLYQQHARVGVAMAKLESLGGSSWRAWFLVKNDNGPDLGLHIRVFGKLHLNFTAPTGQRYGLRVRNAAGQVVFDYDAPMMALAGDTYDTEILLKPETPLVDQDYPNAYDTSLSVPFNMANKSICATTRGLIYYPNLIAMYYDVGAGQDMAQYEVTGYSSMYWANGSTLYVRRMPGDSYNLDVPGGGMYIDNSNCVNTYSRLAVIDNTRYP